MHASNFDNVVKASAFAAIFAAALAAALFVMVPTASASPASLEDGISQAVASLCDVASTEGDELLDAQAEAVGENLAAITEQAAEAREAAARTAAAPTTAASTSTATTSSSPDTINVDGIALHYVNTYEAATAPSSGAGLWMGSDSTTDGSWGYFIGHNPGDFWHVMDLTGGEAVTVTDSAGNTRTYHVVDEFTVPDTTYWEDIESRVTSYGESVILQTCCGDNANYRVVIAA